MHGDSTLRLPWQPHGMTLGGYMSSFLWTNSGECIRRHDSPLHHSSYGPIAANVFADMIHPYYFTLPTSYTVYLLILCGDDLTLGTAISVHHW